MEKKGEVDWTFLVVVLIGWIAVLIVLASGLGCFPWEVCNG